MPVPTRQIRSAVQAALGEDLILGDPTTAMLLPDPVLARGTVKAHEAMILAGVAAARQVFEEVDPSVRIVRAVADGTRVGSGASVLAAQGDARSLLMAERVVLNFLQHLSGVATLTSRFRAAVRGYPTIILDTRKTTPGLRALEKWAVTLGGGHNHRHSLGDGILIKDNHLALLRAKRTGLAAACRLAKARGPHGLRVIVEVHAIEEVAEAVEGGADVVLLDNMTPAQVHEAIARIKGRALVEVSGGITLQNVQEMAAAGANFISIGALTHSAPAANLSMDIVPVHSKRVSRR